jgi:hypothetical protein
MRGLDIDPPERQQPQPFQFMPTQHKTNGGDEALANLQAMARTKMLANAQQQPPPAVHMPNIPVSPQEPPIPNYPRPYGNRPARQFPNAMQAQQLDRSLV